jgi:arylsulfatase A-like enzyme
MLSLAAALLAAATTAMTPQVPVDHPAPNVVFIVVDDLGYGDLDLYGGNLCRTPNIDALAHVSTRFTSGYAASCLCAPSRAGLLTGKYPQRFGFEYNPGDGAYQNPNTGLPLDQPTLGERLHDIGYSTALIGKWHLGNQNGKTPMDRGFDRFYGIYGGGSDYLPGVGSIMLFDDRTRVPLEKYVTDAYSDKAVEFIDHAGPNPFFLFLSYNAVHVPYQAPEKYLKKVPDLTGIPQLYGAMLSAVDNGVGRVRRALKARGLDGNTIVFFMSDNGGAVKFGAASNGILNGAKESFYEGGVRVPMMMSWPGVVPKHAVYTKQASLLDLVPTVLAATESYTGDPAEFDGVNLIPYLNGTTTDTPHETLYWRKGPLKAIRDGDMKWLTYEDDLEKIHFGLYDLGIDVGEQQNLRRSQPETEAALKAKFKAWSDEMMDPLWIP